MPNKYKKKKGKKKLNKLSRDFLNNGESKDHNSSTESIRRHPVLSKIMSSDGISELKKIIADLFTFENLKVGVIIGFGSFGSVYKFDEKTVGKHVKGFELDKDSEKTLYVENELNICNKLVGNKYPGLVEVLRVNKEKKRVYMRYSGEPLTKVQKMFGHNRGFLICLLRDMCEALLSLQQLGLVHRDISERNILVEKPTIGEGGLFLRFTLCDYGMCTSNLNQTSSFKRFSKPLPESNNSFLGDVYHLGMVCLKMMKGQIQADIPKDQFHKRLFEIYGNIYQMVMNMCEPDPIDRPTVEGIMKVLMDVPADILMMRQPLKDNEEKIIDEL